ncbi:MAG: hypothetical protein ACI9KE_001230 [Polyangiales bacterium]|jgi:hypothetical protein
MRAASVFLFFLVACQNPGLEKSDAPTCADRDAGCSCAVEGQALACYGEPSYEGADLVCAIGEQSCRGGRWTECRDIQEQRISLANALIAPPTQCNPCNPACHVAEDSSIENSELTEDNSEDVRFDPLLGGVVSAGGLMVRDEHTVGVGGDESFDTNRNPSDGVELDRDGALILGRTESINDSIWIANTAEGTISRFDVVTFRETGRFWVGPYGRGNDPSRTSINTAGEAFVAGRLGMFLTKISPRGTACPDTNGDGRITTSTDGRALPWGQDDCVVWSTDLRAVMPNGMIRAVAAQDVTDPVTGDVRPYVWVGGYNDRRISLLDGRSGAVLMTTSVEYSPYGFALDGSGQLWISTLGHRRILRIDTRRCNEDGCPWGGVCTEGFSTFTACDDAIKQAIPTPDFNRPYGITVDSAQRVWVGGDRDVQRYTPTGSGRRRWATAGIGSSGGWKAGIAVDGSGNVWTTGSFGVWRLNAENPRDKRHIQYNRSSQWMRGWGVAVAADSRVWVIGRWENSAWVIEPGRRLRDNNIRRTAYTVRNPYTYSDMTGQQLRLAATPRGSYIMRFEGCGPSTRWENLQFDVDLPLGTTVAFRVRTADTTDALASADWYGVGFAAPLLTTLPVGVVFDALGITHGAFAEVEVVLESSDREPGSRLTPRVRSITLDHGCSSRAEGFYQRAYDSTVTCRVPPERPYWNDFEYTVDTPDDSRVELVFQVGDSETEMEGSVGTTVSIPLLPDSGTINLQEVLERGGLPSTPLWLRARVRLIPSSGGESAVLYRMATRWECRPEE